ncbi:MAG: DUF2071 domain-containing protein [Gemmataceae bacterium]|nr:DUF2071 domain-containing protein [Gemmata sp.]MDW8196549.1 DUF2071 domain-containing protein [Gemmataceae bacterium]
MRRKFLTAHWRHLLLANFVVPEELLRPYLPPDTDFDRREGVCWASLVAFQFLNTRVGGIGWPGFRHFPEWNLRFYVVHRGQRGVCFVREWVPQWTVATIARVVYNEPYRAAPMTMDVRETPDTVTATYRVRWGRRNHTLRAVGSRPAFYPSSDSCEHWFKEHSWGFGTSRGGRLIRYQVEHPLWAVYPLRDFTMDVDWGQLYGPAWQRMNGIAPASVVFAVGSAVSVYPKG